MKVTTLIAVSLALCCTARGADPATGELEKLYGADLKRAAATADKRDDAALAARMLADAAKVTGDAPFFVLLCNTAYDLGSRHPDGFASAAEAMQLLARVMPDQRPKADQNLLALLAKRFQPEPADRRKAVAAEYLAMLNRVAEVHLASDRLSDALDEYARAAPVAQAISPDAARGVKARIAVVRRLEALRKQSASAELAELLLVEFDRPSEAAKLKIADPALLKIITLAGADPARLAEADAIELADWYRGRAERASPQGRSLATARARECYRRFLQLHPREDAQRLRATREAGDVAGGDAVAAR